MSYPLILSANFFDKDAFCLAKDLLGKVIKVRYKRHWLAVKIIETEAYYLTEKGSHASLGYTEKRKALFMSAGTIYMYYARGGDSLNVSARGEGNAVLIKSGYPYLDNRMECQRMLAIMQKLNPPKYHQGIRSIDRLCSGQTLLCKSLGLRVSDWDQQQFDPACFYLEDIGYRPNKLIQTKRLGIPKGRDENLLYRLIDQAYVKKCSKNPLTVRRYLQGRDYFFL